MLNKITQAIIAGIAATVAFSIVTAFAPMLGMPKMNPPEMFSVMMGIPLGLGLILHFMIGITFALTYTFYFIYVVKKIDSTFLRGVFFGFAAFLFAQIILALLGMLFPMPPSHDSIILLVIGSLISHVVFGIVVTLLVRVEDNFFVKSSPISFPV